MGAGAGLHLRAAAVLPGPGAAAPGTVQGQPGSHLPPAGGGARGSHRLLRLRLRGRQRRSVGGVAGNRQSGNGPDDGNAGECSSEEG